MQATRVPNGIGGMGYTESDISSLAKGANSQKHLVNNAPKPVGESELAMLFGAG
jgi:hydroxyacid-oxoacid transhydrogenase